MSRQWDALVIGAGPAGLRAASVIAESGLEVVLVDEQAFPGGQIYRHVTAPGAEERFAEAADYRDGTELVRRFRRSGAEYLPETTVWFLEQDRILASRGEEVLDLRARNVIIAVGAMERPVPFRGWTLPGVMNAGAGDILLKTAGLLPETPVVLAGSGPLLYLVASHLIRKGHPLAAVLDQTPPSNMLKAAPHLPAGLLGLPLLLRGLSMLNDVRKSGTPVYRDVSGIEAQGADRLERVLFFQGDGAHAGSRDPAVPRRGHPAYAHGERAGSAPPLGCAPAVLDRGLRRLRQDGAGRRVCRRGLQPRTRCSRRWDSGRTGGSGRG